MVLARAQISQARCSDAFAESVQRNPGRLLSLASREAAQLNQIQRGLDVDARVPWLTAMRSNTSILDFHAHILCVEHTER